MMDEVGMPEDLTDEGIARFLEDLIGDEIDVDFIDQLRSSDSDILEDCLKHLQEGTSPLNFRRSSVTESEKDVSKLEARSTEQQEKLPIASSSKSCFEKDEGKYTPTQPTAIIPGKGKDNQQDQSKRAAKKKKSSAENKERKETEKERYVNTELKSLVEAQPPASCLVTNICSLGKDSEKVVKRKGCNLENDKHSFSIPTLVLCNLRETSLFPNGVPFRMKLTAKLLDEIKCLERDIKLKETRKKMRYNQENKESFAIQGKEATQNKSKDRSRKKTELQNKNTIAEAEKPKVVLAEATKNQAELILSKAEAGKNVDESIPKLKLKAPESKKEDTVSHITLTKNSNKQKAQEMSKLETPEIEILVEKVITKSLDAPGMSKTNESKLEKTDELDSTNITHKKPNDNHSAKKPRNSIFRNFNTGILGIGLNSPEKKSPKTSEDKLTPVKTKEHEVEVVEVKSHATTSISDKFQKEHEVEVVEVKSSQATTSISDKFKKEHEVEVAEVKSSQATTSISDNFQKESIPEYSGAAEETSRPCETLVVNPEVNSVQLQEEEHTIDVREESALNNDAVTISQNEDIVALETENLFVAGGEDDSHLSLSNDIDDDDTPVSPGDVSDAPELEESAFEIEKEKPFGRKSPPLEKVSYKRKNIIESSSDDEVKRNDTDTVDDVEMNPERKTSKTSLPFERKRDQGDSRSRKFDKFEHERQRKLGEKKKGKEKTKKDLSEILKEKSLLDSSFRIPKRTSIKPIRLPNSVITPLASADVPKENLQFERSRKNDKDKWERDYYKGRDFKDYNKHQNDNRINKESGPTYKNRFVEPPDERVVVLAPETKKPESEQATSPVPGINYPASESQPDPEPQWCDDGEGPGDGCSDNASSSSKSDNDETTPLLIKITNEEPCKENIETEEPENDEVNQTNDPEVPVEFPQESSLAFASVYLMANSDSIDLPDVDLIKNAYEVTVMKIAWWLLGASLKIPGSEIGSDSNCDEDESDYDGASNQSFLDRLDFTLSDDEDLFPNDSSDPRLKPYLGPVAELCGAALLSAKYRSGPDDKFEKIFQVRHNATYDKENFQARCTLCNDLVVGKDQLAVHVSSQTHQTKMSSAGLANKGEASSSSDKTKDEGKGRRHVEKVTDAGDLKSKVSSEKNVSRNESRERRREKESNRSEERSRHKDKSSRTELVKRDRSVDHESEDVSRHNKDKTKNAKHSDTKEEMKQSRSRGHRARSKSPHHKRVRSRSPRRRSRSPRSHRRRSRSITRILRSPKKVEEEKEKRRSTSAERVKKFLEKTNRSRSPSNGYNRKRHRRSRTRSPSSSSCFLRPRKDNKEFNEKLTLTAEGKWTDELENRWKLMDVDQTIFMEQSTEKSKMYNDSPESHPKYAEEWSAFWEKRYQEVEEQGLDPSTYDYVPEWKDFWTKRLREIQDIEYEKGIQEIKKRHGMDLESLSKIRFSKEQVEPKEEVKSVTSDQPASVADSPQIQCTPSTPSSVKALSNPPSVASISKATPSVCSNTSKNGEDYTARSMSISDCGDGDDRSEKSAAQAPNNGAAMKEPVTCTDIMSKWKKLTSGEVDKPEATSSTPLVQQIVTSGFVKPPSSAVVSNADSGSIESCDFYGLGFVQVLLLISKLEDQLSFFAEQVKQYFKRAEELDLKKKNKSLKLLDEEDFVVMLFNIRDRFMAQIRANVPEKPILKKLNSAVYYLNAVLDAPQCKKHTSKIKPTAIVPEPPNKIDSQPAEKPTPVKSLNLGVVTATKEKISKLVAEFLILMGRENVNNTELRELLHKLVPSLPLGTKSGNESVIGGSGTTASGNGDNRPNATSIAGVNISHRNDQPIMTKIGSVVTTLGVGKVTPALPNIVVPPIASDRGPLGHREDVWEAGSSRDQISSSDSERRSPFSRRGFTGNPTSNPFRDKGKLIADSHSQREVGNDECRNSDVDVLPPRKAYPASYTGTDSKRVPQETGDEGKRRSYGHSAVFSTKEPNLNARDNNSLSKLPAGIQHLIMQERNATSRETRRPSADRDSSHKTKCHHGQKRKEERRRRHKSNRRRDSSTSTSSSSSSHCYRRERKRKRKRKRDENRGHRRMSSEERRDSSDGSRADETSCGRRSRQCEERYVNGSSSWHSYNNDRTASSLTHQNRWEKASNAVSSRCIHAASTYFVNMESRSRPLSKQRVRVSMQKTLRLTDWETLSAVSSVGSSVMESRNEMESKVQNAKDCSTDQRPKLVLKTFSSAHINEDTMLSSVSSSEHGGTTSLKTFSKAKVTSVSKSFWTSPAEENEKHLSSISSNDMEVTETTKKGPQEDRKQKLPSQYRTAILDKEPGELSSSE